MTCRQGWYPVGNAGKSASPGFSRYRAIAEPTSGNQQRCGQVEVVSQESALAATEPSLRVAQLLRGKSRAKA